MKKANTKIRLKAMSEGIPLWKIADELGVHEITLVKRLRHELPERERAEILNVIDRLVLRER